MAPIPAEQCGPLPRKPKLKPKSSRDRRRRRERQTSSSSSSASSSSYSDGSPTRPGSHPPSFQPPVPSELLSTTAPASDYLLSLVKARPPNADYEVQSTHGEKCTKLRVLQPLDEDRFKYKEYAPSDKTLLSVLIQVLRDLEEPSTSALPVLIDVHEGRGYRTQLWVRRSAYTRPYAPLPLSTLPESFKPFIYWLNEKIWLAENPDNPGRPASDQLLSRVKALPKESFIPTEGDSAIHISGYGTDELRFAETLNPGDGTLLRVLRMALGLEDSSGLPVLTNVLEVPTTRWQDWIRRSAMNDSKAPFPAEPMKELPESFKRFLSLVNEEIWRDKADAASLRLIPVEKSPVESMRSSSKNF
ncbi:unnamed protein product [Bemisia tabaci]|uniref:Uncharacterized protein n=1 Tax=Bemisia tabaci TaxID=7038 RepID=A0A9P0A556_BEMTA|nr:unnamed protein product [Bemisia tabaci]